MIKTSVAVFLIMIGGAVRAQAQDTARSLSELRAVARYRDPVRLLDVYGHEVRGLIYKVSVSDVEVSVSRRGPHDGMNRISAASSGASTTPCATAHATDSSSAARWD